MCVCVSIIAKEKIVKHEVLGGACNLVKVGKGGPLFQGKRTASAKAPRQESAWYIPGKARRSV